MVAPSNVSLTKRVAQVTFAVVFCFTCAGIIFGFAALKPILISEGVYSDLCDPNEAHESVLPDGQVIPCKQQDLRLNLMFTIATVVTNVSALPIGYILDRVGPRRTSILGGVLFALGCFCFGLNLRTAVFDSYLIGYVIIAIGSPLIFLPSFHLSAAFPMNSGLVLSLITGSFDASSLPLVAYRELYTATNGWLTHRKWFWAYALLGLAVVVEQVLIAPDEVYGQISLEGQALVKDIEDQEADERTGLLAAGEGRNSYATTPSTMRSRDQSEAPTLRGRPEEEPTPIIAEYAYSSHNRGVSEGPTLRGGDDEEDDPTRLKEIMNGNTSGGDPLTGKLFGLSAKQQIMSSWFWLMAAFLCVYMLRTNFYIQTAHSQLLFYTGDINLADSLTKAFTYLLPLGGIVGIPFVGYLLDKRSIRDAMLALAVLGAVFGGCGMSSNATLQIISIATLTILRPLMYTAVSDYSAKTFGFVTFGTVYGLANTMSGLFGLVQWPVDVLIKISLNGNYTPVNAALLIAAIVTSLSLTIRIWLGTRH